MRSAFLSWGVFLVFTAGAKGDEPREVTRPMGVVSNRSPFQKQSEKRRTPLPPREAPPAATPNPAALAAVEGLSSPDFEAREAAFERLLDLGTDDPGGVLAALPESPDDLDAANRCDILRWRVSIERGRRLAVTLTGNDVSFGEAAETLFRHPSPDAIKAFLEAAGGARMVDCATILDGLLPSTDEAVRGAAASHLAALARLPGGPERIVPLMRRRLADVDTDLRRTAAWILYPIEHPESIVTIEVHGEEIVRKGR